jgi:hypothetical protein
MVSLAVRVVSFVWVTNYSEHCDLWIILKAIILNELLLQDRKAPFRNRV